MLSPLAVAAVRDAARAVLAGDDAPAFRLPADVSSAAFLEAAERHRLLPFFSLNLGRLDLDGELTTAVAAGGQRERMPALMMARELFRAVDVLTEAGVRVLTFKGIALAQQAYGDFTARGSGDLDLLVSPEDLVTARAALVGAGWLPDAGFPEPGPSWAWRFLVRNSYELPLNHRSSAVDLHWHPAPTRSALPGFEQLWSQRARLHLAGREVDTFSAWHSLRHSCNHASKDDWSWLRSCVDIARLAGMTAGEPPHRPARLSAAESASLGVVVSQLGVPRGLERAEPMVARAQSDAGSYVARAELRQLDPLPVIDGRFAGHARVLRVARSMRGSRSLRDSYRVVATSVVLPSRLGGLPHRRAPEGFVALLRRELGGAWRRRRSAVARR